MKVLQKAKEIGTKIEKSVDELATKASETFDNLASYIPFSNLAKKDDLLQIEVDLPGVDKKDINISIEDGTLSVSAVRSYKNELKEDSYYVCESSFGRLERRFTLPENIDTQKIDAKLVDGRLTILLQKTEESKPRKISIK